MVRRTSFAFVLIVAAWLCPAYADTYNLTFNESSDFQDTAPIGTLTTSPNTATCTPLPGEICGDIPPGDIATLDIQWAGMDFVWALDSWLSKAGPQVINALGCSDTMSSFFNTCAGPIIWTYAFDHHADGKNILYFNIASATHSNAWGWDLVPGPQTETSLESSGTFSLGALLQSSNEQGSQPVPEATPALSLLFGIAALLIGAFVCGNFPLRSLRS